MSITPQHLGMHLFTGNSHPDLAQLIVNRLDMPLGKADVYQLTNSETMVEIAESVRGRTVYILQTGTNDVNNNMMELLIMTYACKTACAKNIVGVIPYLPYSKQSRMRGRGSIVSKLLAKMLVKAGMSHIITMDLHQKEIQGFFDIPVDNLRASPFLLRYVKEKIPDYRNAVIVAKSPASAKKAQSFAERLRLGIAVIHGEQKEADSDMVDGRHSPPPSDLDDLSPHDTELSAPPPGGDVRGGRSGGAGPPGAAAATSLPANAAAASATHQHNATPIKPSARTTAVGLEMLPVSSAKEKPPINIVGDVGGRIAILVDDLLDDVEQVCDVSYVLHERGAYKIYVMATHGLLSADAPRLLEMAPIDEVVVTNTVPHEVQKMQCPKIKTVDISIMLSEAIRRIHNGESMSYLFRDISTED